MTVEATGAARRFEIYMDVVDEYEIPWSVYYLGLGVLSLSVLLAARVVPFPPFTLLGDLAWAGLVTLLFAVSAAVDVYYSRKRRLGTPGSPPELREE